MKNYFAILKIPENASRIDIQAAYRRLAKQYHPDVNKSEDAHEKFCEITEAYEFLMSHDRNYDTREKYDKFREEARERARKQAKMRYEKFKQQHEAFQTSGINDLGLILKIAFRIFGVLLFMFLALWPVFEAFRYGWLMILLIFVSWPFAGAIGWYIYDHRKNYLTPGKLYYSPQRLRHLFTDTHPTLLHCYYCPEKLADSVPYKLELYKLKDVKLSTGGFRQHNIHYVNKSVNTLIPRSQKAFIIHTVCMVMKVTILAGCLIFLPLSSIVWRFIAGLAAGGLVCALILLLSGTKSNVSYLISFGMVCRICLWILFVTLASKVEFNPINIMTSDSIQFVVTAIFIFDCLIMQLLDMTLGRYASRPVTSQYPEIVRQMESGYLVYNDIPVISVAYPLIKWLFN